jgi:DNA polymerase-3 subunit epsilon
MRQIILDTETTGLEPENGHRVIEIGCVEMINRRLTGNRLHFYINPEREVEKEALEVHGLTNDFLKDKPLFKDIAEPFCQFIKDSEIIAHNASFDVKFLNHELKNQCPALGQIENYASVFDTLAFARKKFPGQRNSLDALSKRLSITHFNRDLHGALLDAEILAQVYLALTSGQSQLFEDESQQANAQNTTKKVKKIKTKNPLPIIRANEEELAAHETFLKLLHKKSNGH